MARKSKIKIQVENEPSLERDTESNAVLNRDAHGYAMAVARTQAQIKEQGRISSLEDEILALKELVSQLISTSVPTPVEPVVAEPVVESVVVEPIAIEPTLVESPIESVVIEPVVAEPVAPVELVVEPVDSETSPITN